LSALRFLLIIVLALLQGIAPLVHAHAGGDVLDRDGHLHLPGLETYAHSDSTAQVCAAINAVNADSVAIGVLSGIEQEQKSLSLCAAVFFLPAYLISVLTKPRTQAVPYGPPPAALASWLTARNSRAPPSTKAPF